MDEKLNKHISKVQLPDEQVYNLVPEAIKNGEYVINSPILSADTEFVIASQNQAVNGIKTFLQRPRVTNTYTILEYIESDGNATNFPYILTGVRYGQEYANTLSCVLDGYFTKSQDRGFNGYDGGGQLGQVNGKWSVETNTSNISALERTTILQVLNFTSGHNRLYQYGGSSYTQIADRAVSTAATYATADYPLFVAKNASAYNYYPAAMRLYSFKMYDGDYYNSPDTCILLRDFIPVRSSNNEVGLYDRIENKFYPSYSGIEFTAGADTSESLDIASPVLIQSDVSRVAITGSYTDLRDKPTIPSVSNSTITIKQTDQADQSFTLNGAAKTITLADTGATSVTISGSGNAVSSASYDASTRKLTLTKDVAALTSVKTLKTDNTTSQTVSSSEAIAGSGIINLHKIAKTGDYNDLLNKPNVSESLVEKTYSELKTLRDNSQLVPGTWYRITDYVTTTSQSNTSSAGHQFDIIVKANGANKLDENAYAVQHTGDTYFANSNLSAWKLNYCIDNDTNRFTWAGSSNGKGVVYRMIDEFNNDCPYDFKNILFTVSGKYTDAYTFSYTEDGTIKDASLLGLSKSCYGNTMKEYISFSSHKQQLNFNVFYSYDDSSGWYSNIFESNCYSNTFNFDCFSNKFGAGCYSNTFGYECHSNTLGNNCHNNTFGDELFGGNCYYNTFGDDCYSNTFGNNCFGNTFGDNCYSNTFGFMCFNNTFGNGCNDNTVGDYCRHNTFGNGCVANKFGDSSSVINYCKSIIMDNGCGNLYIKSMDTSASSSNYLQNVHIHLGVKGTSSSKKTIMISDRNLLYETNVYMNTNGNVYTIINEGEGGGSYETATEEEIRALFSTTVQDSQGNIITDANDQIITVS